MPDLATLKDLATYGGWGLAATIGVVVLWGQYNACLTRERNWLERLANQNQSVASRLRALS